MLVLTFCASESGSSASVGSEVADALPTLDTKSLTVSHKTLREKQNMISMFFFESQWRGFVSTSINCDDQSRLHIFLRSSNIRSFIKNDIHLKQHFLVNDFVLYSHHLFAWHWVDFVIKRKFAVDHSWHEQLYVLIRSFCLEIWNAAIKL